MPRNLVRRPLSYFMQVPDGREGGAQCASGYRLSEEFMYRLNKSTRRDFFDIAAGGAALALASTVTGAWSKTPDAIEPFNKVNHPEVAQQAGSNLLTDPQYMVGAKYRLGRFIGRGADPAEAEAVFRSLPNLDAIPWAAAWTRLAEPWEARGEVFEKQGRFQEAMKAYQM